MVNSPLIRPYLLGEVALGGVARIPMIIPPADWKALVNLFLISPLSSKVGGSLLAPTLATGRTAAKMEGTYTLTSSYLIFS